MVVICPITSKVKGLRFEVLTRNCDEVNGAILSSQMKCLDWRKRNPQFIEKCPQNIITVVRLKIALLLGIDQSLLDLLG